MPLPGLGALTSLTGGGGLDASSSATSRTGQVSVGGLTVNAAPGSNQTLFIVAAAVVSLALIYAKFR